MKPLYRDALSDRMKGHYKGGLEACVSRMAENHGAHGLGQAIVQTHTWIPHGYDWACDK